MPNFVEYARNDPYSRTSHFFFPSACPFSILLLCNHPCVCFCIKGKAGYVAQGSNCARDRARNPLFTYVNEDKLKSIETYARTFLFTVFVFHSHEPMHVFDKHLQHSDFINLLDNYEMSTGVSETVTSEELQENRLFIDSIMKTDVMKVQ